MFDSQRDAHRFPLNDGAAPTPVARTDRSSRDAADSRCGGDGGSHPPAIMTHVWA